MAESHLWEEGVAMEGNLSGEEKMIEKKEEKKEGTD